MFSYTVNFSGFCFYYLGTQQRASLKMH